MPFGIAFYDPKKKIIVDFGSSKPCGCNGRKLSFHAEEEALNYCRDKDKKKKYHIYIWRYSNAGFIKSAFCCNSCSNLIHKYNYENKIYTFKGSNIVSAITDNPETSLGYKILRGF